MKSYINLFLSFMLIFTTGAILAQETIPGQYIVIMRESNDTKPIVSGNPKRAANREQQAAMSANARDVNANKVKTVRTKAGVADGKIIAEYADVLVGFAAQLTPAEVSKLKADPDVADVFEDQVIALSPVQPGEGPSNLSTGDYQPCGIQQAGGAVNGSNKGTWIWILDTGIDGNHSDLNVQKSATFAKSFIAGQSALVDGNGHGTHVAGTAAAKLDGKGVAGVSAGARVVPVKVLSNAGSGSWSGILAGLNHVAKYRIAGDVVNMSLGAHGISNCNTYNTAIRNAILNLGNAGVWVVIASGNNGKCNGGPITYPGCINGTRIITVGAMTCQNTCASFSNWGSNVDYVAVGVNVYSTWPGNQYRSLSGTSMAAPHVAGVIHARGNAPASAGNINCCGRNYRKARR